MASRLPALSSTRSFRNSRVRKSIICPSTHLLYSSSSTTSIASRLARDTSTSSSKPLREGESIFIPASTSLHNSLSSFLHHAATTSLSPSSSVYIGTHYEYTVLSALTRLGFSLIRIGGRSDNGIDLVGTWQLPLPHTTSPMRVVLSCKAGSSKNAGSPAWVRELEGAFGGAPVGWRSADTMGFVVTTGAATKGVRDAVRRSTRKVGFVSVSPEGVVEQFLWNGEVDAVVGDGLGVGVRYLGKGGRECVLMWRGDEVEDWEGDVAN